MIELGLTRISRLLRDVPIPWQACHVAGTNGKGSICAYTSAMLHASGLRCGRFTSPHLIDRWDCITVEQQTISRSLFERTEARFKQDNLSHNIRASEFEILTATAFSIFRECAIDIGVIEVGLGGLLDATNVLESPLVTVIAQIGLDHQALLGRTIEEITSQKAGIMKRGVPCLVDGSNNERVRRALKIYAAQHGVSSLRFVPQDVSETPCDNSTGLMLARHQKLNTRLALEASRIILQHFGKEASSKSLLAAAGGLVWPGRLHFIRLRSAPLIQCEVLLDGAHNDDAAHSLGEVVDERLRTPDSPVLWVIAISRGRSPQGILRKLLRPGDSLVATTFGPVDGMPWVAPLNPYEIIDVGRSVCPLLESLVVNTGDSTTFMSTIAKVAAGRPIIFTGSLYLISDVLRAERVASGQSTQKVR